MYSRYLNKLWVVFAVSGFFFLGIQVQVFADSVSGSLTINEESIQSGDKIKIYLQSPPDALFWSQVAVFKDPRPEDVIAGVWSSVNCVGLINISLEQDSVSVGTPFEVTVDTLNYAPGKYYFENSARKFSAVSVFDSVDILPPDQTIPSMIRQDVLNTNMDFAIYSKDGQFLSNSLMTNSQSLVNDSIYILAVNLSKFSFTANRIDVDFYNGQGTTVLKYQLMRIKIDRKKNLLDTLSVDGRCGVSNVDMSVYPNGITLVYFRTPKHYTYYEYDGQFQFKLNAVGASAGTCGVTTNKIIVGYNDLPAAPPLPLADATTGSLATYNVKLIRIGYNRLMTQNELAQAAETLTAEFQEATKNHFKINIVGYETYPIVNDINRNKVISWYMGLPKTPGKPVFDLNNPDELYLATLMYYSSFFRPTGSIDLLYDINRIRPLPAQTDDYYASYWVDELGSLGQGAGYVGSYVMAASLYSIPNLFFTTTEGQTTYHYDISACSSCGGTTQGYLDIIGRVRCPLVSIINTSLHEFGHGLWRRSINVSTGDNATQYYPFNSDFVWQDESIGYFTRMEYMSYGRDRSALNQTYGDEYLEQLIGPFLSCPASTLDIGWGLMETFPATAHNKTVTLSCPSGYIGTPARTCNFGVWGDLSNGCVPSNTPPVLTVTGDKTVNEGQLLSFFVSATDPEGDALTYTVSGLPSGASFSGQTFSWTPSFIQAGSYTAIFTVSDGALSDEETITITVVDVPMPDLTISGLSTTTTAVAPGNTLALSNTVANQGTASAGGFTVSFSLSTDAVYGGTDDIAFSATRSVSSLAAGASSGPISTSLTVPATTPLGNYYVCATADSGNTVAESEETNNDRCTTTTIQVALPDLVMTQISGPAGGVTGTSVSLVNTVKNQGVSGAGSFYIGFYLSTDATITTNDVRIGTRSIGSLAAGASKSATTTLKIPATFSAGTYYIGAIADYNSTRAETDETNNALTGNAITLTIGADLVVSAISGPPNATRGTSISIPNTVLNQGTGSSSSSYIGFYLSTDANITTADRRIGRRNVGALAAGASSAATSTVTVPTTVAAGTYYIGAIADYTNTAKESNETNNARAGNAIVVQ